jgi:hypothetical protein
MDISFKFTLNEGWEEQLNNLLPTTRDDRRKVLILRQMWWAGAKHMLKIIIESSEICKSPDDHANLLAYWSEEIAQNAKTQALINNG